MTLATSISDSSSWGEQRLLLFLSPTTSRNDNNIFHLRYFGPSHFSSVLRNGACSRVARPTLCIRIISLFFGSNNGGQAVLGSDYERQTRSLQNHLCNIFPFWISLIRRQIFGTYSDIRNRTFLLLAWTNIFLDFLPGKLSRTTCFGWKPPRLCSIFL